MPIINPSSGSSIRTIQNVTATGAISSWNSTVVIGVLTANITLTLPQAINNTGKYIDFQRTGNEAFTVTIVAAGGNTLVLANNGSELSQINGALEVEAVSATAIRQNDNIGATAFLADYGYFKPTTHTPSASTTVPLSASAGNITLTGNDINLKPNTTYRIVASLGFQGGATVNFAQYLITDSSNLQLPNSNLATGASQPSTNGDAYGNVEATITTGATAQVIRVRYNSAVSAGITFAPLQSYVAVYQLGTNPIILGSDPVIQTFTTSGTYTPTAGLKYAIVKAVGGGGGGGGSAGNPGIGNANIAGGGSSGAYVEVYLTSAQIGVSQTVTIGAGGINGVNGTATTLGSLFSATGGLAGTNYSMSGVFVNGLLAVARGGNPSTPTVTIGTVINLRPSGRGGDTTGGQNTSFQGFRIADGGDSEVGVGATGVYTNYSTPTGGTTSGGGAFPNTGGGGAGSATAGTAGVASGGAGGSGKIIITEYFR